MDGCHAQPLKNPIICLAWGRDCEIFCNRLSCGRSHLLHDGVAASTIFSLRDYPRFKSEGLQQCKHAYTNRRLWPRLTVSSGCITAVWWEIKLECPIRPHCGAVVSALVSINGWSGGSEGFLCRTCMFPLCMYRFLFTPKTLLKKTQCWAFLKCFQI